MLGYLFGILITGLIITSVMIDCFKTKDELKRRMQNKIKGLQLTIEKDRNTFKYETESINSEIVRIKNKISKSK